ncbi:SRSF protein kinase 3-like [Neocloeon triangulifer]|uniref:SRSF protein kinase 3-like n=1 Tax=Neocloeon triangulifer TaxID=2078957 RepID=UPI00286F785A|nr:SRSF protein kinase 3-like [Neocloeon triangulifer]
MSSKEEDDEQEDSFDYCPGGYHPLALGEWLNQGRYFCTRKLGWGQFSTVWLAWDTLEKRFVAIKVVKSSQQYTDVAKDEIRLLLDVRRRYTQEGILGAERVVQLLDNFQVSGPNGIHQCMVFDVLGVNLLKLVAESDYKGIPLIQVKQITRQVLEGLHYLHNACGVIHCDIKPENILLATTQDQVRRLAAEAFDLVEAGQPLPPSFVCSSTLTTQRQRRRSLCFWDKIRHNIIGPEDVGLPANLKDDADMRRQLLMAADPLGPSSVVLADLGNACYIDNHFSDEIQTRQYRCFEVLIGAEYGPAADIWSVACVAYELATGRFLFSGKADENGSATDNHIASIEALLGPAPKHIALAGHLSKRTYMSNGLLRPDLKQTSAKIEDLLMKEAGMDATEAGKFSDFLKYLLHLDWTKRPTAYEALQHPWLKN